MTRRGPSGGFRRAGCRVVQEAAREYPEAAEQGFRRAKGLSWAGLRPWHASHQAGTRAVGFIAGYVVVAASESRREVPRALNSLKEE